MEIQTCSALPVYYIETDPLYGVTVGNNIKTIAITSANPTEGVSTVAYSLALRSASANHKVLLMECNLHRPAIAARLGINSYKWTFEDDSFIEAIQHFPDSNLSVLPAPAIAFAPVSFMENSLIKEKWQLLLESYDIIIADCASVNNNYFRHIPAEMIASICDATIMVTLGGSTQEESIQKALKILKTYNANLIGTVMNDYNNSGLNDELSSLMKRISSRYPKMEGLCQTVSNTLQKMQNCM